ncbi:MAG: hypothetical protein KTR18_16290 [Acidiferrobacterales bacterium]|nr:hypothetical protein [Acidiferrobacterales bacterium]
MTEVIVSSDQKWLDVTEDSNSCPRNQNPGRFAKVINSIKQFASISEMMRVFGAMIMVASMSMFLAQGWTDQNDIQRYLKLLTQTGLLAGAGLLLSLLLKEYRGARMFFGLSLVSVPANFTVIGALVYSAFNISGISEGMPTFAQWTVAEGMNIGLVATGAFAAMVPVTWFAFRIMARRSAGKLTIAFMLLNTLLLLPVRSGIALSAVFLLAAASAFWIEQKFSHQDTTLTTPGGVFARALLFLPALLVYTRSAGFYVFDPVLNMAAAVGVYMLSRYFANTLNSGSVISIVIRGVQALAGFVAAFLPTQFISSSNECALGLMAMNLILAFLVIDFRSVRPSALSKLVVTLASVLASVLSIMSVIFLPSAMGTVAAIATGLFLIGYGLMFKRKMFLLLGGIVIAASAFYAIGNITELLMQSGWIGLGVLGGGTIVCASLLDRYGATVKLYLANLSDKRA